MRLIVDMSHPEGKRTNNGISKPLCFLHYVTIDDVIHLVIKVPHWPKQALKVPLYYYQYTRAILLV